MANDNDDLAELAGILKTESPKHLNDTAVRTVAQSLIEVESSDIDSPPPNNEKMWATGDNGRRFAACERAVSELPAGQYTIENTDRGIFFRREDILLDELMILPDSHSSSVISEIERFWTLESKFREFKFLWKRGVMLWGPPGSGKTSTLQLISSDIVDRGGIAVYVTNPHVAHIGLQSLRTIEKTRNVVVMLEDIDALIAEYGESELLAIMDGELQIDNVVFVATTNYPERLDKRFVNRPSRFDIIKRIGMPSADAREMYLRVKNPRLADENAIDEMAQWIKKTDNFSFAHLKEMIISVEVFGRTIDESSERLHLMNKDISSHTADNGPFGFTSKD